jgi:3-phenylpropionate/cinnamic acid dioxygenase small subunit
MTNDELKHRLAIADRLAVCAQAGDAGKADAYAACFTEHGVLELAEAIAGRAAIGAWMRAFPSASAPSGEDPRRDEPSASTRGFVSHHLTTCTITLADDDTAKARTYWLVTSGRGLDHNGYYDDVLRRDDDGWLIARRRPRVLWRNPARA